MVTKEYCHSILCFFFERKKLKKIPRKYFSLQNEKINKNKKDLDLKIDLSSKEKKIKI